MTTIVFSAKHRTMAADKMIYTSHGKPIASRKIFKLDDGSLLGISGKSILMTQLLCWANAGFAPDKIPPDQLNEDKYCLLAHVTNVDGVIKIYRYENGPWPFELEQDFIVLGSGADAATAALMCDRSPAEAVKIAEKIDVLSCLFDSEPDVLTLD